MKRLMRNLLWFILACTGLEVAFGQRIVINEIMYHPASENVREEFVELYNAGPTNVLLNGWRIVGGIDFLFPSNQTIQAGGYLVVAADPTTFLAKYPGVSAVVGGWIGILSNSRNRVELENAAGQQVDAVTYADEGDWAVRRRGLLDNSHYGWIWHKEHDGLGKSLELINPDLPNQYGQSWAASLEPEGTPGRMNSVWAANLAPLVLNVAHFPVIPTASDNVTVTCRILDEQPSSTVTVRLHWRIDSGSPPPFTVSGMSDDGQNGDGVAGDGLFGVRLGSFLDDTVIEFFVEAADGQGLIRTWPAAAQQTDGSFAQTANALLQVEDNPYTGQAPLYKLILTSAEYNELGTIFSAHPASDAQMNATFVVVDGTGVELRYLTGVRNRGHGSRYGNPHNYRINYRSDEPWLEAVAVNLNARTIYAQHMGAVLAQKAGATGADSRAVQLSVNNGPGPGGTPQYGHYAANEVVDSHWAERHFPFDGGGNVYKVIRDIRPPNFNYRGANPDSYRNTYFKQSNESEDDWSDLIAMLQVMGENSVTFTTESAQAVVNVEQWLAHMAVMSILGNNESGLNTGNNDDYYLYSGVNDRRFILIYHDLDQILGFSSLSPTERIFRADCCPISGDSEGSWRAFSRFMHWPDFEPLYYATLQRLIDTVFSAQQFDPLVDQTLGHYVPTNVRDGIKNWMNQRRTSVQSQISGRVPPPAGFATLSGEPKSPTWMTSATLLVGGSNIVAYRYKLNNAIYTQEIPIGQNIRLTNLPHGSTNTVYVLGKHANGSWQSDLNPTVSRTWVVNTNTSYVRLNEVLSRNDSAVNHHGTFPDLIELYNEFLAPVDLAGMRLTDDPLNPNKFVFPTGTPGTIVGPRGYLVVYANNPDGTPGLHTGFALDQTGEGLYLYDAAGRLVDSVEFGQQLPDLSIGRLGQSGVWMLTTPTFGSANVQQPTGDTSALKINEWLTAGISPFFDDFIELHNPGLLPVDLSGHYLTDEPIGAPRLHRLREATLVPAQGYLLLIADGDGAKSGHVGFRLGSAQGRIALLDARVQTIDYIAYGPQRTGVSMGRCPNGAALIQALALPTPGAANACPSAPVPPITIPVVAGDHVWRYNESGANLGNAWRAPAFDDSSWPQGPAILANENCACTPDPIRTWLNWLVPQQITFYFRTTFNMPSNVTFNAVQLQHAIDDGAVFYINGQEAFRYNMPAGQIRYDTLAVNFVADANAYSEPVNLPLNLVQPGLNHLAVEVHNQLATSGDIVFGMRLNGIIVTNTASQSGVVINEILASNTASIQDPDGSTPDMAELYNPSANAANLAGLRLADGLAEPRRIWTFPPGSILPARGFLAIRFNPDQPVSTTNTGFALPASGGSLYLLESPGNGGGELGRVHFGLQTADFSIGRLPDGSANWVLTLPTLGSANIIAPLGDPGTVRINEWMAEPASGADWFELYNPNDLPVAIGGFYLTDNLAAFNKSPLPALSFIGGVSNGWQKFVADGDVGAGADHVNFSLKLDGEALGFFRPNGSQIDAYPLNNQGKGVSEGRLPDGSDLIVRFPTTASPGERNFLPLTNVVVNEVLTHTDPPLEDAIELHNPTATMVDLGSWWLSDSKSSLFKYQIPPGTQLQPGGYVVFYENRFNDGDFAAIPFSLSSAKGDQVHLTAAPGGVPNGYRHTVEFGPAANGVSFGRYLTSVGPDFVAMNRRTLGVDNPVTLEHFRQGQGLPNADPLVGPIVFTEIMYHPPDLGTNDNVRDEFVELHNITPNAVPLYDTLAPSNTWRLRKGVDFDFPLGVSIPAGGYLLVVSFNPENDPAARTAFEARYGYNLVLFGPYSGKLDNGGETIELRRPDSPQMLPGPDFGLVPYITVERIQYLDQAPWPTGGDGDGQSLQRINPKLFGNDPVNWRAGAPTPEPGTSGLEDTDGDGMPDAWEIEHGLDPNQANAHDDPDGDGMTNLEEFGAGTDPLDPNSVLRVELSGLNEGLLLMRFTAMPGKTYSVLYRQSLGTGSWQTLTNVPAQSIAREITVADPDTGAFQQRFYQILTPANP